MASLEGGSGTTVAEVAVAETGMLIRRPVADVFRAVVEPAVTTHFWFTHSTGPLAAGAHVRWDWEMYGSSTEVDVEAIEENRLVRVVWSAYDGPTTIEWSFEPFEDDGTFVQVSNRGFAGDEATVVRQALSSLAGFSLVLAGMKAYLEHGIELNLVRDRFPQAWRSAGARGS